MRPETIKITADWERGYIIINKDDFDPETQERYDEPKSDAEQLEALKKEALELKLEFGGNIGYDTLLLRVEEAKAK